MSFQLLGLAVVSWAFARIGVHRPSLRFPYLVFSIRSYCHWISIAFLLYGRRIATHSVDPSLTRFLGEFPGLGLALVPDAVVPEAEQRCAWSKNSIQISALAGVEPRHLAAADVATRLLCTPPLSRLLRHAGGYSRTILTPNLQGLELGTE